MRVECGSLGGHTERFADDGRADSEVRERLAAAGSGAAEDHSDAVVALCGVRLLVPVRSG